MQARLILLLALIVFTLPFLRAQPQSSVKDDPLPENAIARMGTTRLHPGANVYALCYSPDGKVLVSGARNDTLIFWDARTGKELRRLQVPKFTPEVAFSRDGKLLASSHHRAICIWQTEPTKELLRIDPGRYGAGQLAFTADGKHLISTSGWDAVKVWSTKTGKNVRTLDWAEGRQSKPIGHIRLAADGSAVVKILREADNKYFADIREPVSGKLLHGFAIEANPSQFALSADGKRLATWTDWIYSIYDTASGKRLTRMTLKDGNHLYGLAFVDDDQLIAWGGRDGLVWLWDLKTGKLLRSLARHRAPISALGTSKDGKIVASGDQHGTIHISDLATGKSLDPPSNDHIGNIYSVAYAPDGKSFLSVANDPMARVWDASTGKLLHELAIGGGEPAHAAAYSPDGRFMAAGNGKGVVSVWNARSAEAIAKYQFNGGVRALAFTPDGSRLYSAGFAEEIVAWDTKTGKIVQRLKGHLRFTTSLAISPDGKTIASGGGFDYKILLRELGSGKTIREIKPVFEKTNQVSRFAWSPDGKHLVSGGGDGAVLWDVANGKLLRVLSVDLIYSIAISVDGKVALGHTKEILVVTAEKPVELAKLRGHHGRPLCVAFSPDGKKLVSGGEDSTLFLWDVADLAKQADKDD